MIWGFVAAGLIGIVAMFWAMKTRNIDIWVRDYVRRQRSLKGLPAVRDVYFCVADHFEPCGGSVPLETARSRVERWCRAHEEMSRRHRDSDGRPPRHTFFYPAEEYDAGILDILAEHCRKGLGDVEVHLHHDQDTAEGLRAKILRFTQTLNEKHGLLNRNPKTGLIEYAFVHGNWALDNSRRDGKWCGVDNELAVLKETGCTADFTLPSAPSDTQTRKVNSLYFARGIPGRRKSHDTGVDVSTSFWDRQGLLLVQGPLGLNWRNRKWGILPRIENAEISHDNWPSLERARLWEAARVHVQGVSESIFVKVHTHGAQEKNFTMLFDEGGFDALYGVLDAYFVDHRNCRLHFVTAREMVETIRSLSQATPIRRVV